MSERRAGVEFRIQGRTLSGRVMVYGDLSLDHGERFLPGAFGVEPRAALNIQHDRSLVVLQADEYVLEDTARALSIRAELPPTSAALALVRRGALRGLSVEFIARRESVDRAGFRVIEAAELMGIGLVDQPSYPSSVAEVRRRPARPIEHRGPRIGMVRGTVPTGRKLDCQCAPGNCDSAVFEVEAFADTPARPRDVLVVVGEYSAAIASRDRGGVRLSVADDGALDYEVDVPSTTRGRELLETFAAVPVFGRPVIDTDASDYVIEDRTAVYTRVELRALTIGPTDAAVGWAALELGTEDGAVRAAIRSPRWVWL